MEINESTPRVEKKIAGILFQVPAPFEVGHITTEATTNMLNQTYKENVGNNFAPTVNKAKEAGDPDQAALQVQLDTYVAAYIPGVRPAGTGGTRSMDPVTKIAFGLVRTVVVNAIKGKGEKITGPDGCGQRHVNKLTKQLIDKGGSKIEAVRKEAQRQFDATKDFSLEDLTAEAAEE